jgi:hypothetical protein
MKLAAWLATRTCLVITPLAGLLLVGCKGQFEPPRVDVRTITQISVLSAATNEYDVSPVERPPKDTIDRAFPGGHSVPDDLAPSMTIATMTLKQGHAPSFPKLLARITSTGDFAPMGIRKGMNYVWRDASDTAWVTPARPGPDHKLELTPGYQFPPRPERQPSLFRVAVNSFAFVLCLDDCPTGHCGMY